MSNEVFRLCSLTLLLMLGLVLELCIAGHAVCATASTIQVCSGEYVRVRSGIFVSLLIQNKIVRRVHINFNREKEDAAAATYI